MTVCEFKAAVEADSEGRATSVQEEIKFVLDREELAHTLCDLQDTGKMPLRVTHNDTKLNNIMIDDEQAEQSVLLILIRLCRDFL